MSEGEGKGNWKKKEIKWKEKRRREREGFEETGWEMVLKGNIWRNEEWGRLRVAGEREGMGGSEIDKERGRGRREKER